MNTSIILIIFFIIISIYLFGNKNSYFISCLLPVATIIILVIFMGGSTADIDNPIYQKMYLIGIQEKAIGFQTLMQVSKSYNLTYIQFRTIVAIIGYLLIYRTVCFYTKDRILFFALYAIYPFLFDIVQLRNFLAMAFMVFAIPYLHKSIDKPIYILLYIAFILVASSMQVSALFYLVLAILPIIKIYKGYKRILIFFAIMSVFLGLNRGLSSTILQQYGSFLLNQDTGGANYLQVNSRFGWIINWFQQFSNFYLIYQTKKYIDKTGEKHFGVRTSGLANMLLDVNLIMFITLPLLALDENYTRLIRNIMVANMILYTILFGYILRGNFAELRSNIFNNRMIYITILILVFQLLLLSLQYSSYANTIVFPVFHSNYYLI